jgi:hypothetical protein
MGGTTFEHYASGALATDAFGRARDEAGYESGHGGYSGTIQEKGEFTVITNTPLLENEAYALAHKLIEADDPRIRDKWGPAGAIPVVTGKRTEQVSGFGYTPTLGLGYGMVDPALLKEVEPLVKLAKGETITEVYVSGYSQPQTNRYQMNQSRFRAQCTATVTIAGPPTTRLAPVCVEIPGGLDYDQKHKEIATQVERMRLKQGESVIGFRITKDTPGKAKVVATAPKGTTTTRFVIKGAGRHHSTWETGFDSQAEARAFATEYMNDESKQFQSDNGFLEVESVTRRSDGQALVRVERSVAKRMVDVEVEVKLANVKTKSTPDGWLFFGWASC